MRMPSCRWSVVRGLGVCQSAVVRVEVGQGLQLFVGRGLGGDQVVVGARLGAQELVELPLRHYLFSTLGVLNGEHHDHRD